MKVILAPRDGYLPNKSIDCKRWMKNKCYYKRINKKLLKKYGRYWHEPCKKGTILYSEYSDIIMCRPEDLKSITEAVKHIPCDRSKLNLGKWEFEIEKPRPPKYQPRILFGQPLLRNNSLFRITV